MGVKHRGHTEPAGAPRRRFAGCSAVGRWGMRDGFRFVPAADAPSQTQSIPSAPPAALCVALCCQNAGRGRDGGAHPVHDPWSERVHPMQGNLPRNPKESERRMVKQPQSSPWAGDKVWPHPRTGPGVARARGDMVEFPQSTEFPEDPATCNSDTSTTRPANTSSRRRTRPTPGSTTSATRISSRSCRTRPAATRSTRTPACAASRATATTTSRWTPTAATST